MRTRTEFPHRVKTVENLWIPLSDGVRLAARAWFPGEAENEPVPAVLEYLPYRKRDGTRSRDEVMHHWLAGHGYACLRVDMRGSGDSMGVLTDEYLETELSDGEQVLAWIADQPWCSGKVAMIGISWGGFNGLQLAARRPPELAAVVTACSTDDRYADDVHYMGGCLLGDNLSWASVMFSYNSLPPDPEIAGPGWRLLWAQRLDASGLWLNRWLEHQRRDAYWKHGSICEDYSRVQTPVLAVSGWTDGYSNSVFRLLANLDVPRWGLLGPWGHKYPHQGVPGPAIGFLQEVRRFLDRFLKGADTGIDSEPMLRAYMQEPAEPAPFRHHRPGRWVAEDAWPSARIKPAAFALAPARLLAEGEPAPPDADAPLSIISPLSTGLFAGKWCSYAQAPDLPHDQREEDGGALVFDSAPLEEDLEILGSPQLRLSLSSDKPQAMVAVRLSDVHPGGQAERVTYAVANLSHRDSHEHPEHLTPNQPVSVHIHLNGVAHSFKAGHRLRVAVSTSYWPLAWTSPEPATLTVLPAKSRLELPARNPAPGDDRVAFEEPEGAPAPDLRLVRPGESSWRVIRDLATDKATLEVINDQGVKFVPQTGTSVGRDTREYYGFIGTDPASARGEVVSRRSLSREGFEIETRTRTVLTCDAQNFVILAELDAYENGRRVYSRNWERVIPRDHV